MSILDSIKKILGVSPPTAGEIDRGVASATGRSAARPVRPSPQETPLSDLEILPEYRQVEELLAADVPIVFVTGGAGTGKSTMIRWLVSRRPNNCAVVAPTGVAALNAEGVTIHSFFRFPPAVVRPEDIKVPQDRKLYRKLSLLIIDEWPCLDLVDT